ncbi:hypothetical protein DL240_11665 [Lujinxingia litoralis]|uniref:Alpha-2-macroglobulin n=1 Tax=Lujinxingia litoralis TaxID=2211119 RepID=A0A328C5W2_9DELT|nr:alpha-2-macroglobulin family protein [Lujinxingia litoralis]RAL21513.1 hypothetical protein DL240_11665 [Lujinxingia litoralis]
MRERRDKTRVAMATVLAAMLLAGCSSKTTTGDGPVEGQLADAQTLGVPNGMLGEDQGVEMVKAVRGEELSEEAIAALLDRMEPLEARTDDKVEFRRRSDTMPPAVPGEEVKEGWPPDLTRVSAEAPRAGTLEVQAYRPQGAVEGPIQLSVSFSRPMVAVGQVGQAPAPPISLSPAPQGRWRWLGTRTAVYEVSEAWPRATAYEVEVAREATSIDGSALAQAVRFGFETAPAKVSQVYPVAHQVQSADAPVHVVFNQPVKPEVITQISVRADRAEVAMEEVRGEDAQALRAKVSPALVEAGAQGRVVTLVPVTPYPDSAKVEVKVAAPIPAVEGPILGQEGAEQTFNVRGPFRLQNVDCYGESPCLPQNSLRVAFTNPISENAELGEAIAVMPPVANLQVHAHGTNATLQGDFLPNTTYQVVVSEELQDRFGQPLKGERSGSVAIGPYRPFVAGPAGAMVVLPADRGAELPIMVGGLSSLRARVYQVSPGDWEGFRQLSQEETHRPPGRLVHEQMMSLEGDDAGERHQVGVELAAALNASGQGHVVVVIDEPSPWPWTSGHNRKPRWNYWVQVTDLSLDLSSDRRTLEGRVTSMRTGKALDGLEVFIGDRALVPGPVNETFSAAVPTGADAQKPLVVRRGEDQVMMLPGGHVSPWGRPQWPTISQPETEQVHWFVIDDRGMYKPGEEVTIRGWVRAREPGPHGELKRVESLNSLSFVAREPRGNEIKSGRVSVDRFGGFELRFEVPEGANLGWGRVELSSGSRVATSHGFQIQEFRRPEYEVSARALGEPHIAGEELSFEVEAAYYAGGGLGGAPVRWVMMDQPADYAPPGHEGWSFGDWRPYWGFYRGYPGMGRGEGRREAMTGQTDAQGRARATVVWNAEQGFARSVNAVVSVTDVNRQSWEASARALLHPAQVYVGLKSEQNFVKRGDDWEMLTRVVALDGQPVEGRPVEVVLYLASNPWSFDVETAQEVARCATRGAAGDERCVFKKLAAGAYRAVATVQDEAGRSSVSQLGVWVAGRDTRGVERVEEQQLVLIPGQESYRPGEVAEVMVSAPFYPMDAQVALRRNGRYQTQQVRLTEEDPVIRVPIDDAMTPGVHLVVQSVGAAASAAPDAFARGELALQVEPVERRLTLAIEPTAPAVEPGSVLGVDVVVTDHQGKAVADTNVLLFAVDEAVLALSNYELRDPLSVFYAQQGAGVYDHRTRRWLVKPPQRDEGQPVEEAEAAMLDNLAEGAPMGANMGMRGGGEMRMARKAMAAAPAGDQASPASTPIAVREVFDALAFFDGELVTDENGRVRVERELPDSLTRYRLMAVAVDGERRFGRGESQVVARLPLMVRPSAPRFLNVGDRFEFPVVLHNQTDQARTVDLALRAVGALKWLESPGRRVEVPAGQRVEVRWRAEATSAGEARVQVAAVSGSFADAELVTLPVLTPATAEAFATYGSLAEEDVVGEQVQVPQEAFAQYGGLEFSASSTQLQALTDAFIYLTTYRYACSEQLASRLLSVLALYDVLEAFDAEGLPSPEELKAAQQEWVDAILLAQRGDGGFGFWKGSTTSWPFVSVHATHALWMAKQAGLEVPDYALQRARAYLQQIDRHMSEDAPRVRATVQAYATSVLAKMGVAGDRELDAVVTRYGLEELPLEAMGWLLPMARGTQWEARFVQRLTNNAQESAATAEFQDTYAAGAYRVLYSGRRTDAVVLDGLMQVNPQHPLVEKVMRGLLAHRTRGRWSNTQENVFVILAMRRYFDTFEATRPEFVARAWVGEAHFAEHRFEGRTGVCYNARVPMSYLQEQEAEVLPVVIERQGQGRMYYRLGVRYAPRNLDLPASSEGMEVERVYEAIDHPDDVRRAEDGAWEIRAGARVRVTLTMSLPARRYHVALVDWLPAGLEAINTNLAVSQVEPGLEGGSATRPGFWWWSWRWYEHQNTRDERVEAFASLVNPGVHTFNYVARATTPGSFVAPPARAEEMYHPETFGRSATERVRVMAEPAE